MSNSSNQGHYVKRIVLPSGKTIDVVYFSDAVSELTAPRQAVSEQPPAADLAEHLDLHVCPECYSELVYPTSWEECKPREWRVTLRCPECEWADEGSYPQDVVDRFDEVLDLGTEGLINDLRQLTCANMAEEIDLFVHALDAEAIQPMDF